MFYVGAMQGMSKNWWYNHKLSFLNKKYENSTSLSQFVWKVILRQNNTGRFLDVRWYIL